MKETTLDTGRPEVLGISAGDRFGAWLYTGAPGRLASFSIDLGLSLAALAAYGTRLGLAKLRGGQWPAA
jgi:hypothetical protein